jgi:predicted phosphodiesterase
MTLTVMCAGDIHIGRRLSRIDQAHRTADAWKMIVDLAIREQVDLLALSGDVIDAASKSYEALGPMLDGLSSLANAGIDTVAVAGNHDFDVLPRLIDHAGSSRFHLLGRGGSWERFTLYRDGAAMLHVDGWSFPTEHVSEPPLRHYSNQNADDVPVMALLHGDVGVPLSRYAPISLDEAWPHDIHLLVLGHIHSARIFPGPGRRQALYTGSPWALDPGEPGVHGVWMATFENGNEVSIEQRPIAPVRYESHVVNVEGVESEDEFQQLLSHTLVRIGQDAIENGSRPYLSAISLRLRFSGESPAHHLFPAWVDRAQSEIPAFPVGPITIYPDAFSCDVRPRLELETLVRGAGPVAETARMITALQSDELAGDYQELVNDTLRDLQTVYEKSEFVRLRGQGDETAIPLETDARALLTSQAWRMLSLLVEQMQET